MAQTLGIIDIYFRGKLVPVEKGAKLRLSGLKNNAVVYGRRVGRAQEFAAGEASGTTHFERGQRFADIYGADEGELQVKCDTGQTYVMPDAFLIDGPPEMTGGEGGKVELKWSFGEYEEIVS